MADAVRRVRLIRLVLLAGIFVTAWALLHGHVPWAAVIALLITAVAWVPVMFVLLLATEMGLRYQITVDNYPASGDLLRLAAARGAAGDHAEQIWLLRRVHERGNREAYRLLLQALTEHGTPGDVTDLRWTCVGQGLPHEDPLCTPWPGIDGPGLLDMAEQRRRNLAGDVGVLRSLAVLLDAAGRPDPGVWRALVDARVSGFHLPLARHLADTGRLEEATGLMRAGAAGQLPNFQDTADFLREHGLLRELEQDARMVWERDRSARALAELRQLLTDQSRLDELARLPKVAPSASRRGASTSRWPGTSASSHDFGSSSGYSGYGGYGGGGGGGGGGC